LAVIARLPSSGDPFPAAALVDKRIQRRHRVRSQVMSRWIQSSALDKSRGVCDPMDDKKWLSGSWHDLRSHRLPLNVGFHTEA
jgi:hypothetical protein